MSPHLLRRGCAALTSLALAGSVALLVPTSAQAATASRAYGGSSYGSTAKFGDVVNFGRTANQPLCTTKSGVTKSNNSAAVTLPGLGNIGAQVTKVQSVRSGSTQSSITTTTTAGVSFLSGTVTADSIVSTAKVTFNGSAYVRTGSTKFVGLRVLGVNRSSSPPKNTEINLPGVGKVILNQQGVSDAFDNYTQSVTGLRLIVDTAVPGLPAGQASVAYALASLHSPKFARAYGNAYATQIRAGDVLKSGPTAIVHLPCGGTSGKTRTNNIVGVGPLATFFQAGAATTTAKSTDSATAGTNATTTARIADINVLGGLVTADAITAKASATRKGTSLSRTSAGTTVANLEINGNDVPVGTDANQRIGIPGVGNLYIRRSSLTATGLQVYALQLVLTEPEGGLPIGTVINVGAAQAGVA